jgi:Kdo2-lipid IVA lauroyltransferase/acyltransferase
MNRAIEQLVLADPAQYQWDYKRFKRPPPGQPYPYPRR